MLQINGYNLIGDNEEGEAEDFINRFIPTSSFKPWLTQFWPGWNLGALTSVNGYRWGDAFKLNKLYWPSGASRWAYGHFLCNSDTVGLISDAAFPPGSPPQQILFNIGNPESNDDGTIVSGETMAVLMYLLPPTPLSGLRGLTGMTQSLYLLTVVDSRYFWWWYNFGNQTIDMTTTWQKLIDAASSTLNITIKVDAISSAYLAPSVQAYSLPYEPLPLIIDSIAYNIGMRFVAGYGTSGPNNPGPPNFNPTYAMQLYQTALTALNADFANNPQRAIVSGGQRFNNPL